MTSGFLAPEAIFPHPTSTRSPSSTGCSSRPCTPTQSRFLIPPVHVNGQVARGCHSAAKSACQHGSRRPHFFPGPLTLCCPRISGILPRHLHSSEGVYNVIQAAQQCASACQGAGHLNAKPGLCSQHWLGECSQQPMDDDCTLSPCDFTLSPAPSAWPILTLTTMGTATHQAYLFA